MLASLTLLVVMNGPVTDHREFKDQSKATAAPRLRGAVRVGANQDPSGGRQEICLALSGGTRWSIESCGTGAGFLAPASPAPDLAHFRIRYQAWSRALESGWLIAGVQGGFAELEIGEDDPGFHFTSVGPRGLETAGPSVGASIRWVRPVSSGLSLLAEINGNLVYFHHAPELVRPQSTWQPSLSLSLGLGF